MKYMIASQISIIIVVTNGEELNNRISIVAEGASLFFLLFELRIKLIKLIVAIINLDKSVYTFFIS